MKKVVSVALAVLLLLSLCACSPIVNLKDYFSVTITGLDGDGTAYASFNHYSLHMKELSKKSELEQLELLFAIDSIVTYSLDKSTGLSNGDKVTLTIDVDKELAKQYGFYFIGGKVKTTVKGLDKGSIIDPFSFMEYTTSGTYPDADIVFKNTSSDPALSGIYFSLADSSIVLEEGKQVEVVASYDTTAMYDAKFIVQPKSKLITIGALDKYISSGSEIDNDSYNFIVSNSTDKINARLAKSAQDIIDDLFNSWSFGSRSITTSDAVLLNSYLLNTKGVDSWNPEYNRLVLVYYIDYNDSRYGQGRMYMTIVVKNIKKLASGEVFADINNFYSSGTYTDTEVFYNQEITALLDRFTVTELGTR